MRYARVTMVEPKRTVLLQVTGDSERFLIGTVVNRAGVPVEKGGKHEIVVLSKNGDIERQEEMHMNLHYGELEYRG